MYLSELKISNFRCFDEKEHVINFKPGLTVLVGENDAGKTAILDAICIVLGTTDFSWHRIFTEDFYHEDTNREIKIACTFDDLTETEQGAFLECLSYPETNPSNKPFLCLTWSCYYSTSFNPPRAISSLASGKNANCASPAVEARELLRVTFLKALRDSYSDMQSGRHSRLSQVFQNLDLSTGENRFSEGIDLNSLSLAGIADLTNELLQNHPDLKKIEGQISDILCQKMVLANDPYKAKIEVANSGTNERQKTISLLEKLDLVMDKGRETFGKVGLGTSNVLSMACELLLQEKAEDNRNSSFLLIEEPEAHTHAQRQLKIIQSLEKDSENEGHQVIVTTHSPLLASVVKLENIIIVNDGKAYPLAKNFTRLDAADYQFLEKFLDATKANLFFARNVVVVEGPGEALLLPTLSKLLGLNFIDYGTSIVNAMGTGLSRYSKILQRKNSDELLPIKVACITDRDIMPDCAPKYKNQDYDNKTKWPEARHWKVESDFSSEQDKEDWIQRKKRKADGQNVKSFVSNHWTLEYDLFYYGLKNQKAKGIFFSSIAKSCGFSNEEMKDIIEIVEKLTTIEDQASFLYSYFLSGKISKAVFAQNLSIELDNNYTIEDPELRSFLPPYLVAAIEYATRESKNAN